MDFLQLLESNRAKLTNVEVINHLMMEIILKKEVENAEEIVEYGFHYPVDTDSYLQELLDKFDVLEKQKLTSMDGRLRAYMLTFIHYCGHYKYVTDKTIGLATELYFKIIGVPEIGTLFMEKNLYELQLTVVINFIKKKDGCAKRLLKELRNIILKYKSLDPSLLKASVSIFLLGILCDCTVSTVDANFSNAPKVASCCLKALKEIILHEEDYRRLVIILVAVFQFLRKNVMSQATSISAAMKAIMIFWKDIVLNNLEAEKMGYVIDSICLMWSAEDLYYFDEIAEVVNCMEVEHYKEMLHRLSMYSNSKNHVPWLNNLMLVILALVKNPPNYPVQKYEVVMYCILRNICILFVHEDRNIANAAIDIVAQMCSTERGQVMDKVFQQLRRHDSNSNFSCESLILALGRVADIQFGLCTKNHKLLIILARIVQNLSKPETNLIREVLDKICKDSNPSTLKNSLPILHNLFYGKSRTREYNVANCVLKIIFRNAMHQDHSSQYFANHIFSSLLEPTNINGRAYLGKLYYDVFLTSEFEYELLFKKCQRNIKTEHIVNLIKHVHYDDPKAAVLLGCLLEFQKNQAIEQLSRLLIAQFEKFSTREIMGPLCSTLITMLNECTISEESNQELRNLYAAILVGLRQKIFHLSVIKPVCTLFKKLRAIVKVDDTEELNQVYLSALPVIQDDIKINLENSRNYMYLNEICMLLKRKPPPEVLNYIQNVMNTAKLAKHSECPQLVCELMTLLTTIDLVENCSSTSTVDRLVEFLESGHPTIKINAFKLLNTICRELLEDYTLIIKYGFKEIVEGDPTFVKICTNTLEELIHEDYIRLNAESFFKFIYSLGCSSLSIFMQDALSKRFLGSNQNDITKFYINVLVYKSNYSKFQEFPIDKQFEEDLLKMKTKMDNFDCVAPYLFACLPIKRKFNVLCKIVDLFEEIHNGTCKVDENFYSLLQDFIATFKYVAENLCNYAEQEKFYAKVCKHIKNLIITSTQTDVERFYEEYSEEVRKCTLALLKLLFTENNQILDRVLPYLFDSLMCWIEYFKAEIIHYIHVEQGDEYREYFSKLLQFCKKHKHLDVA